MNKLEKLMSLCNNSVTVTINPHRDYYQTVEEYIKETTDYINEGDSFIDEDIGKEVFEKIVESNTIIHIQAYPENATSFYQAYHYDLQEALNIIINTIENTKQ